MKTQEFVYGLITTLAMFVGLHQPLLATQLTQQQDLHEKHQKEHHHKDSSSSDHHKSRSKTPKVTFILICEDFPYNQLNYLRPYLKGGIGKLLDKGVVYTNANYAEFNVSTGPSHAAMSTGALGQVHGIVDNSWYNQGVEQRVSSDYTNMTNNSLIYVPHTSNGNPPGQVYPVSIASSFGLGCSARNMLADTFADQFVYYSPPDKTREFFYVVNAGWLTSQTWTPAGQLGKPFIFDQVAGGYTSSQAYFPSVIVTITDATGVGAFAHAHVVDGVITEIAMDSGGHLYSSTPTITLANQIVGPTGSVIPPTTPATLSPVVVNGVITAINVENGGAGYNGGLPQWVVNWNNRQKYNNISNFTQTLVYPPNSPAYNRPYVQNYSNAGKSNINVTQPVPQFANAQGYISGTTLTITLMNSGAFTIGQTITGPGIAPNTIITAFDSGTIGFAGTYTVSVSQTVGSPTSPEPITVAPVLPLNRTIGGGASGYATIANGSVASLTLLTGGSGYFEGAFTGVGGISPTIGVPPIVSTHYSNGVVTSVSITNNAVGSGFEPANGIINLGINGANAEDPTGINPGIAEPFFNYAQSPEALHKAFDFIYEVIKNNLDKDEIVIMSNLGIELAEEDYGLFALDTINSVYMLDIEYGKFMKRVKKLVNPKDMMFGMICDEGANGDLTYWNQEGYYNASQISLSISSMNAYIRAAIPSLTFNPVQSIGVANVWMGVLYFQQTPAVQQEILQAAQAFMLTVPQIKDVFITSQILNMPFEAIEENRFLKTQVYSRRSGQLLYTTYPLNAVTGSEADARSTWNQVYHSPLMLYQKGRFQKKTIHEPVYMEQLPITLSELYSVPRPSGAPRVWGPLPGLFK